MSAIAACASSPRRLAWPMASEARLRSALSSSASVTQAPALRVHREHGRERHGGAARREGALHRRGIFSDQLDVEHRVPLIPSPYPLP